MKFAAFVMTYERENLLLDTIRILKQQSLPPQKILIVDNSANTRTRNLIKALEDPTICYHRVGYNSGPAGAAKIGLEMLSREGYDWIYWGDDDDPPIFEDTFEILLNLAMSKHDCGCVGAVGHFFNKRTGVIERVPTDILVQNDFLVVDIVGGGMNRIVNGNMIVKNDVTPSSDLFFGFEELDCDLKIARTGFKIYVDTELYLRHRKLRNNLNYKRKFLGENRGFEYLSREYYSIRSLLFILSRNKLFIAFLFLLIKCFVKTIVQFRFGIKYGIAHARMVFLAVRDYFTEKFGKTNYIFKDK